MPPLDRSRRSILIRGKALLTTGATHVTRLARWLASRKLECLILALGIVLRLSMITNYRFDWNYDSNQHWEVIAWILEHKTIPSSESVFSSFHPPLYYVIAAWLVEHGWTRPDLAYLSVACGVLRLIVIWVGLEFWIPRRRVARVFALGLAAVLCASVHIDGMIYAEPLSGLVHAVVFTVAPFAFTARPDARLPLVLLLGLILGTAFLIKISALVTLGALGMAVGFHLLFVKRPMHERAKVAATWSLVPIVMLIMCGWYFVQNIQQYGSPTVTSFNLPSQKWLMEKAEEKPVLDRRSLGYVVGWSHEIHLSPHRPSALRPHARFFPMLVATGVVDYWGFGYPGYSVSGEAAAPHMRRSIVSLRQEARAAMFGGTAIFFAMVVAGLVAILQVIRRRDAGRFFLLIAPVLTLGAAIHFAVVHPIDDYGVVKAAYLMFGAPPAFALFGLAVDWSWRRRARWPFAYALSAALGAVTWYSVQARLSTHYPWEPEAERERAAIDAAFSPAGSGRVNR